MTRRQRLLLDRAGNRPLGDQLADQLRDDILTGRRPPGSQLPTEAVFSRDIRASRTVVRVAVATLITEGLVEAHKGYGVFVLQRTCGACHQPIPGPHGATIRHHGRRRPTTWCTTCTGALDNLAAALGHPNPDLGARPDPAGYSVRT